MYTTTLIIAKEHIYTCTYKNVHVHSEYINDHFVYSVSDTDVSCQKNRVVVPKQRTASIPLVLLTLVHSLIKPIAENKLEFDIRPMHTGKCAITMVTGFSSLNIETHGH